jgi:Asp-tRNA(Asn)/Glu-tRNA(Gln) amidotransferase C subunit
MVKITSVPDEPSIAELDSIRRLAALVSLPLMEEDIAPLASSMRRLVASVEPLLAADCASVPEPTLFDPRR